MNASLSWLGAVGIAMAFAFFGGTASAAPLTVELRDGRRIVGELDSASNAEQLRIRITRERIALYRSFRWDQIAGATTGDESLTAVELQERSSELATRLPKDFFRTAGRTTPERVAVQLPAPRVASLQIEAEVANWDADSQDDGLLVRVLALDVHGEPVAIRGRVEVALTGLRSTWHDQHQPVLPLGHWGAEISAATAGRFGSEVRLPFQTDPALCGPDLSWAGRVAARLSVSGQGTFDAEAPVVLRPYDYFLDVAATPPNIQ